MAWGVDNRLTWRGNSCKAGADAVGKDSPGGRGSEGSNKLPPAMLTRRWWWRRKSAPWMGTETGASWKVHWKRLDQNWRGIILNPLHVMAEPLDLTRRIPELEKQKLMLLSLAENSWRRGCPWDTEERMRNPQGDKTFCPASQLVFRPGAGLFTLLGLVSVCPVESAGGGDGRGRPLWWRWEAAGVLEWPEVVE